VLQWNVEHIDAAASIGTWCDGSTAYLETKEEINSIADAEPRKFSQPRDNPILQKS